MNDLKLAWAEIRRSWASANLLKWSTNLMNIQMTIIDNLPADHPRRVEEKQILAEFVDLSRQVRGAVPKRPGRPV